MQDYSDQFDDYSPSSDEKKELLASIIAEYISLESRLWEAQRKIGGDGSFGFQNARHRLMESKMWVKREFQND